MAQEIELKVRQASGITAAGPSPVENVAPLKEKADLPIPERGGKSVKGQKAEKHMEA
jgi:hypothetical protein